MRTYAYDPVGNRLSVTRDGTPMAYGYDAADRLLSVGGTAVTVDAAGNLTARGSDAFTYDAANRLVSATMHGVTQTTTYDGDGTRVATTVDSTTTSYVHDLAAGLPLIIDDGTRRYVWGPAAWPTASTRRPGRSRSSTPTTSDRCAPPPMPPDR